MPLTNLEDLAFPIVDPEHHLPISSTDPGIIAYTADLRTAVITIPTANLKANPDERYLIYLGCTTPEVNTFHLVYFSGPLSGPCA